MEQKYDRLLKQNCYEFENINFDDVNISLQQQRKKIIQEYLTISTNHLSFIIHNQKFKLIPKKISDHIKDNHQSHSQIDKINKSQKVQTDVQKFLKIQEKISKMRQKIRQSITQSNKEEFINNSSLSYLYNRSNFLCKYKQQQNSLSIYQDSTKFQDQNLQLICSQQKCSKYPFLCQQNNCKCKKDHKFCKLILLQNIISQLRQKLEQPITPQAYLYFQSKIILYEFIMNKISQQREILKLWYEQLFTQSIKTLFLYGFNQQQTVICYSPKILYAETQNDNHKQCNCYPLKIRKKHIKIYQKEKLNQIYKNVNKIFSSIISYLDTKIQNVQKDKYLINLNPAEMLITKYLKNKSQNFNFLKQSSLFTQYKRDKKDQTLNGSLIFLARQYKNAKINEKQFAKKFNIQSLRQKCQSKLLDHFTINIQGKSFNELFCWMKKADYLQSKQIQSLRISLDNIQRILNENQDDLFDKSISCSQIKKFKQLSIFNRPQFYTYRECFKQVVERVDINNKEAKLQRVSNKLQFQNKTIGHKNQMKALVELNKFQTNKYKKK